MFTALLGCQRGTWAHSPLYQWMTNNYEAMSKAITGKKVRWQKMSEAAESAGLMNVNGEPPKPATVRSTWYRVRKAVSAMHSAQEDARNKASAARAVARAASQAHKPDDADGRETLNRRMAKPTRICGKSSYRTPAIVAAQSSIPKRPQTYGVTPPRQKNVRPHLP